MNREDALYELFASDGWRLIIEDARELVEMLERQATYQVTAIEQLYHIRGRLMQLNQLVNLETTTRAASQEAERVHTV